jgi:hypothetical protein
MKHFAMPVLAAVATSLLALPLLVAQQSPSLVTFFNGSKVTFTMPAISAAEHLALGPVVVCVEFTPIAQCFRPPNENARFGTDPTAKVIELKSGMDALLFDVQSYAGGSGSTHLLALLQRGPAGGKNLANLTPDLTFGNQSEYRFWNVPSVSDMPLLVVADASWAAGEAHFSSHRFLIGVYSFDPALHIYSLRDEYMTSSKYPSFNEVDVISVLEPEREEILARLKRQR